MAMLIEQPPTAVKIAQMTALAELRRRAIALGMESKEAWQEWAEAQMRAAETFAVVLEARARIAQAETEITNSRAQLYEIDCQRIRLRDVANKALQRAQAAEAEARKAKYDFDGI